MKTITRKVDKRAWQSIKAIQACTNMIDVNLYISRAILDTFKLRNLGLSKAIAKKEDKLQEWQQSKDYNSSLMIEHQYEVRAYLLIFVPKHLRMYISNCCYAKHCVSQNKNRIYNFFLPFCRKSLSLYRIRGSVPLKNRSITSL